MISEKELQRKINQYELELNQEPIRSGQVYIKGILKGLKIAAGNN